MNKIGINYNSHLIKSADKAFGLFSEIGFDAVFTDFSDLQSTEAFAKTAQKNKLLYESMHAPFDGINSIWLSDVDGEIMLKRLCACVEACGKFGIPVAVVHLSSGIKPPSISDIGHERFDELVETAVKNNVTLAFENQRKLANIAFIFETYSDVENVKFCWDIGHEACFSKGTEFMPLFGNRLAYTHIHDNLSEPDRDLHLIPFDGNIDFTKCADYLKKYDFGGTLTLEILPQNSDKYTGLSAENYYRKAYNAAKKLRNMINPTAEREN